MKLKTGIKAPAFKLPDQEGELKSLKDFEAKYVVLYFYPKDMTPGCTVEAQEFSKKTKAFEKLDTAVVGISGGDSASKQKFCAKHKLKLTLLADEDFSVAKKFGVYGKKQFMGNTYTGISRATFIINSAGKISHIFSDVKPQGHADEVLKFLADIGKKHEKGRDAKAKESPKRDKRLNKAFTKAKASDARRSSANSRA